MMDYHYEFEHAISELEDSVFYAADVGLGRNWHERARQNVIELREKLRAAEKILELAAIESFEKR